ncbi:hypothetical protein HYALB_00010725 [Hymenoscyphus albidus]|uniref:HMG box domain-containing protein n=1 Tax=Hymenoscyphus albidus TaxID=595503 RepID=A0A9N9LTM8_9HELO|nr:hypothetical protein HYALB_00010725 [Hymenoscyphus albidus]
MGKACTIRKLSALGLSRASSALRRSFRIKLKGQGTRPRQHPSIDECTTKPTQTRAATYWGTYTLHSSLALIAATTFAMLSIIGRAAIRRSGGNGSTIKFVSRNLTNVSRTSFLKHFAPQSARTFATAKVSLKVKATKSATAKPKTKAAPAKKTPAKKAPAKKAAKKVVKKPVKKPVKKKAKPAVKKPKARKALTPEQKQKIENKKLKALLLSPPTLKPQSAWKIVISEAAGKGTTVENFSKEASARYKSLSAAELEAYQQQANENKLENQKIHARWLESLTPEQVRLSNQARRNLQAKKAIKTHLLITDSRAPKRPQTVYGLYTKQRWASGDFKGVSVIEATRRLASEFRALSEAEKKPFLDQSEADRRRYKAEYLTVYGRELGAKK